MSAGFLDILISFSVSKEWISQQFPLKQLFTLVKVNKASFRISFAGNIGANPWKSLVSAVMKRGGIISTELFQALQLVNCLVNSELARQAVFRPCLAS